MPILVEVKEHSLLSQYSTADGLVWILVGKAVVLFSHTVHIGEASRDVSLGVMPPAAILTSHI